MNRLTRLIPAALLAAAIASTSVIVLAHEVTHNGTVVALKTAKYAQAGGGSREVQELEVAVVDPKTKKVANRVFTITATTKLERAGKALAAAQLTAQKDEKVAVVVDHDKPGDEAIAVRFAAAANATK
jgi:molybdopterin/thiamine biosynthesis adenylyltransferase